MVTKTKPAASGNTPQGKSLEALFSEALKLVDQAQHDQAVAALESVRTQALSHGMVALARSAGNYLAALQSKSVHKKEAAVQPELAAQVCLNRGEADEALALLDKALKADGQDARLHYLKATALAQKGEAEAAAEALRKAVALNPDFCHQFRLERDFDRVRSASAFSSLGQD